MTLYDLPEDEQFVADISWGLAIRQWRPVVRTPSIVIAEHKDNLRMRELIVEWALAGYQPAQRLWARITEARFG